MQTHRLILIALTFSFQVLAGDRGTQELTFIDFHDPDWVLLRDESGREITASFYYELIQYEDISKWKPNEQLIMSLTEEHGVQITRQATGESYTVVFQDYDPIAHDLNSCLSKSSGSSMEIGGCYYVPTQYWKGQANSLLTHLLKSTSPALAKTLQLEQQSWELYQETRNTAIRQQMDESWGTKQIIENAEDSYLQAKSRAQSLEHYF